MSVSINGTGSITGIDQGFNVTTGSVGIGTDNPGHILDVYNSAGTDCLRLNVNGGAGGSNKQNAIRFSVDGDVKAHMGLAVDAGRVISGSIANDFCIKGLGSNNILFATNSSERLRITSAGQLNLAGNMQFTAATPELEFNNGGPRFRVPAANTLTIHTGSGLGSANEERLRITSSGNVAIGHNSAPTKLGIRGTSASTDATVQIVGNNVSTLLLGQDAAGGVIRGQGGSNQIKFKVGGSGDDAAATGGIEALRIDSDGRLMIGQTSAYAATGTGTMMLTVTKNASNRTDVAISNQFSGDNASAAIVLATHGQDYILEATGSGNTTDGIRAFRILKGSDERLRIDSNGKVGINEAAPDRQLHVKSGANSTDGVIRIESANDNIMDMGTDGTGHFINCVNTDPFSIKFAGTEKFRIDSTGQITLNDSPGIKLSVKTSSLYAQDGTLSYYGTNNGVYLNGAGPDGFLRLNAAGSNGENYHNTIDIAGSNNGAYIMFRSQNNERLRIVNSVAAAVHVKGETALTGTTGNAKGLSIATAGGTSCPLYFGTETDSAQKSMYLNGYWIYLRGHQNEGIRFVFSQAGGNAPRSDQYQFKYNQATRPTGNTTWDGFSDRRAKENVQDVTSALDTIGRLRPVTFDWTNDYADRMNMFNMDKSDPKSYNWFSVKENGYDETRKNNNVGFIAQEFEEVFPKDITETEMELGDETITDFKTVNFDSLVPMLTKAVQELKAENDSLKARLDAAGL